AVARRGWQPDVPLAPGVRLQRLQHASSRGTCTGRPVAARQGSLMNLNLHSNHKLLFSVIFFGFLALSAIIAIAPAMGVEASMAPLPGSEPLTALEHEGLKVYIAEGCVACHTQQVRPLAMDDVWGRAAVPADFAHVGPLGPWSPYAPALLGSSR